MGKYKDFWWCMEHDAEALTLSPDAKHPIRGVFTNMRVDRNTIPEGINCYDIRHNSETGNPISLEPQVAVNHYGTFLTRETLKMTHKQNMDRTAIAARLGGPTSIHREWRGMGSYTFGEEEPYDVLGLTKKVS